MNVAEEKTRLIRLIDEAYCETMTALLHLSSGTIVHPQSGWRVQDCVGHLAAWEAAVATSLEAHARGGEYRNAVPGDEFNQIEYEKRNALDAGPIYAEWAVARARVKAAIEAMSPERFTAEMLAPWGARGSVSFVVEDTIGHEKEHRAELLNIAH